MVFALPVVSVAGSSQGLDQNGLGHRTRAVAGQGSSGDGLFKSGQGHAGVARRLCILASEDVGLADPQAMVQAAAASQIVHLIGMPEGLFPLSQATIYLANAPKSNAVKNAYSAAAEDAASTAREPVPLHLRNAVTSLMKTAGYGQGYRYVHDDPQAQEEMPCLPDPLRGRIYFKREDPADEIA